MDTDIACCRWLTFIIFTETSSAYKDSISGSIEMWNSVHKKIVGQDHFSNMEISLLCTLMVWLFPGMESSIV